MHQIPIYQGLNSDDLAQMSKDIANAFTLAEKTVVEVKAAVEDVDDTSTTVEVLSDSVLPNSDLLGVDPSVYRQINAALKSGKQHLMFYGPPGTGKTTLAQHCARSLASAHSLITGSSDWSSQDVIGGYQPVGNGKIAFVPGILLRNFDRPLIIDELNRCDIDKVIGPLFTVLSGQKTTLPYRVNIEEIASPFYEILPKPLLGIHADSAFAPGQSWRIIATINSIDKASLYQMSYALTRRFAWIYVDVPIDLHGFIASYLRSKDILSEESTFPMAEIWSAINDLRPIGAAPIIDWANGVLAMDGTIDLSAPPSTAQAEAYLDAFDMFLLPMLDGIFRDSLNSLGDKVCIALGLAEESEAAARVRRRLSAISV